MIVHVYWNLHKDLYSLRHKGKVIRYETCVVLDNAIFHVNENGRQRVLRDNKKNVHAYVKGTLLEDKDYVDAIRAFTTEPTYEVTYNPYKHNSFCFRSTGTSINKADRVILFMQEKKPVVIVRSKP